MSKLAKAIGAGSARNGRLPLWFGSSVTSIADHGRERKLWCAAAAANAHAHAPRRARGIWWGPSGAEGIQQRQRALSGLLHHPRMMSATSIPDTMKAIVLNEVGDASKLSWSEREPTPKPGPGEVLVSNRYSGLNYHDTYTRTGLYKRQLPLVLGTEGGGRIVAVGEGVDPKRIGQRVAYLAEGSYAQFTCAPSHRAVHIPHSVEMKTAVCLLVQGLTAHYLATSVFHLAPGSVCLIHAAGGGTGGLLVQLAKQMGATVIALSGSVYKSELAKLHGADHSLVYRNRDGTVVPWLVEEVKRLSPGGQGVDVAYDSVGMDTAMMSLKCVKPRGMLVLYGNASGPAPPIPPFMLQEQGSIFVTRPKLHDYMASEEESQWRAREIFGAPSGMNEGQPLYNLKPSLQEIVPLCKAAEAHNMIESRKTTGKVLLEIPAL